jgi:hypothetical protein
MKFYLKYINPAVALTILFLCTWSGIAGGKSDTDILPSTYIG